jgi:pimeloyl-ACP methyl ester carboxylesterase
VTLAGTLVVPDAAKAVVIFVHGSGPMDRDENSKGAKLNIFNTLADAFFDIGVASLRYDKRGVGASGGNFKRLRQSEMVADLAACIAWVQSQGLGPVYLCGHSEGTAIAPAAAAQADIAGLVLLCPYLTSGPDLLRWQAQTMKSDVAGLTGITGAIARLLARVLGSPVQLQEKLIKRVLNSNSDFVWLVGKCVPARWLRDFLTADVAALHRTNQRPTLVLAAERDCQCPPADAADIARMNPQARLAQIDDLSHLLRATSEAGFLDYKRQLSQPMDPRVADLVCAWLAEKT